MKRLLLSLSLTISLLPNVASAAEQTLRVVMGTPINLIWNRSLEEIIEGVNERGKGVVRIELLGGPEAVPVAEQFRGLSNGLFDIHFGPNQYFQGDIPASQAFNASNRSAMELRADGGWDAINKYYNEQGNIQYLGYFGSGFGFHLLLADVPPEGGEFGLDFNGLRVRGTGSFGPWFERLGITLRDIQVADIYTSLERGAVDGIVWPTIGAQDLGIEKFIKARIIPSFWQTDLGMSMNLDTWNSLSDEAKTVLNEEIAAAEARAHERFTQMAAQEAGALEVAGAVKVEMPRLEAFLAAAYASRWGEILQLMGDEEGVRLRDIFYRP